MELTKHPNFSNGNELATTHGVWSARRVNPVAREIQAALLEERPDLADHAAATWAWSRAESRCLLLEAWIDENGFFDEDGKPTPAATLTTRFEKLAQSLRSRLGLDPVSQAQLATDRANATMASFDLEALRNRGREILNARS